MFAAWSWIQFTIIGVTTKKRKITKLQVLMLRVHLPDVEGV